MKKLILAAAMFFVFALSAQAQTVQPSTTSGSDATVAATQTEQQTGPQYRKGQKAGKGQKGGKNCQPENCQMKAAADGQKAECKMGGTAQCTGDQKGRKGRGNQSVQPKGEK